MPSHHHALQVFAGGATGTGVRWLVDSGIAEAGLSELATLALVNTVGSFVLGWFIASGGRRMRFHPLFATGLLGSFTTFSGFTIAIATRLEAGTTATALSFMVAAIAAGFVAAIAGRRLGRMR